VAHARRDAVFDRRPSGLGVQADHPHLAERGLQIVLHVVHTLSLRCEGSLAGRAAPATRQNCRAALHFCFQAVIARIEADNARMRAAVLAATPAG
jgi:hypothetical protein